MKRGINKRGQFYLLAAIVIISVILGFSAVSNYAKKKSPVKIYDLGEEIGIESGKVLDFGIYNEYDEKSMTSLMENFTNTYTGFAGTSKKMNFIVGNVNKVYVYAYTEVPKGEVSVELGGQYSSLKVTSREVTKQELLPGGESKIVVTIEGNDYEFYLKPGENFYFIISQDISGETHVITG